MIKVGITGGIASGKSTICHIFTMLDVPVYNSDSRAQQLMLSDNSIINSLKDTFGNDIYESNGILNKVKLSKLVFNSDETRQKINSIVHPAVRIDFHKWAEQYKNKKAYVIQESAILFETGIWKNLDLIITVTCPLNERIERIIKRNNCSIDEAKNMINSQMSDKEKTEKSTFVIESSTNKLVIKNIINIHNKIIKT